MPRHFLKSCRETALVLFGAAAIIAAILTIALYLLRNSNEYCTIGNYELTLIGGQLFIMHVNDSSRFIKLDKPDLLLLAVTTSLCVLAWVVFMRWRSSWRRGPQGLFPLHLSKPAAQPIAVVPIGAIALDGSGAVAANAGIVLADSPRAHRSKRTILWLVFAAGIIFWTILIFTRQTPSGSQKWLLDADESRYLSAEGHQRRGRAFEALVGRMTAISFDKNRFTWPEVQQYLGPPDLYAGPVDRPNSVVYFYNRFGKKDWMVFISFDSQGKTRDFGFNATVANSLTGWSTYPTTLPATMPANAKR